VAGDLRDLANRMDKLNRRVKVAASEMAVEVAKDLTAELISTTPVDVSTALSSWVIGIGAPSSVLPEAYFPGWAGDTRFASARSAYAVALMNLAEKKPGQVIFITNNQDYIIDLNDGSSKQQTRGFVQRAVMIARRKLKLKRLKLE